MDWGAKRGGGDVADAAPPASKAGPHNPLLTPAALKIDGIFGARYGNSDVCVIGETATADVLLYDRLRYCSYSFLSSVFESVDSDTQMIEDALVWNALQPVKFGDDYQPISVELRVRRENQQNAELPARRTDKVAMMKADEDVYLPKATLSKQVLASIKDKTLRGNIVAAVHAVYVGNDPDSCRNKLGTVRYMHDERRAQHLIMIEDPPSMSYWFMDALVGRFPLSLKDICFERLSDKDAGLTKGTCMILKFAEPGRNSLMEGYSGYVRAGGRRTRGQPTNPY